LRGTSSGRAEHTGSENGKAEKRRTKNLRGEVSPEDDLMTKKKRGEKAQNKA